MAGRNKKVLYIELKKSGHIMGKFHLKTGQFASMGLNNNQQNMLPKSHSTITKAYIIKTNVEPYFQL